MNEFTTYWDGLLRTVLLLSHPLTYAFCITFGYWCIKRKPFVHAIILVVITMCINVYLKEWFQVPPLPGLHSWRFPSGHAQTIGVFWLWLLLQFPSIGFFTLVSLILALVGIGLVHFNFHLTIDVLVAYAFALITVISYQKCISFAQSTPFSRLLGYLALASVICLWSLLHPTSIPVHFLMTWGFLSCFLLGNHFAPRFTTNQSFLKKVALFIVGFSVIAALFLCGKQVHEFKAWLLVYCLIGLWTSWGYPNCIRLLSRKH